MKTTSCRLTDIQRRLLPLAVWLIVCPVCAAEEIPAQRARQIEQAAPATPHAKVKAPRRVLIWITPPHLMERDPHKGYCIPYGTHALVTLGNKTGAFEPTVSGDLAMFLPENISQFDAIVLNNSSGPWITPTDKDLQQDRFRKYGTDKEAVERVLRKSLLDYVKNGGGIAAIHYAIGANRHWPQFHEMLGARYAGHPWHEEVGIKLDEPDHPLLAAFDGKNFRLTEEIYQFGPPYARDQLRVLMSLDTKATNMNVKSIERTDDDFALAWVRTYGKGRIFYTAFGHRTELYWNPTLLRFYLDGIQFATGDLQAAASRQSQPSDDAQEGFVSLFNGKDLTGWEGDRRIWSVRDGAITGQTTDQVRVRENNFLLWSGGRVKDFELRLQYKLVGGNSGIYFHAEKRAPQAQGEPLVGPQADFSADHRWTGVLMEYTKRDILAERGQRVLIDRSGRKRVLASLGDPQQLLEVVNDRDWNDYAVLVRGEQIVLKINGVVMCEVTDKDPRRAAAGHLALQVHVGPPMTVQFKNIRIKQFE